MRIGADTPPCERENIGRAQLQRAFDVSQGELGLAAPDTNPALYAQRGGGVRVERACACDSIRCNVEVALKIRQTKTGRGQDYRIIPSEVERSSSKPRAFVGFGRRIGEPAERLRPGVTMRGHRVGRGQVRVELYFLLKDLQRLRIGFPGQPSLYCKSLHQTLPHRGRKLVRRAPGLHPNDRRLDRTDDARRHLVLEIESMFEPAVEVISPDVRAGRRVDELTGDANAIPRLAMRPR